MKGRLLCYEGLAKLLEFRLQPDQARATFVEGCKRGRPPAVSRLLREFASFEKRQGRLDVRPATPLPFTNT